VISTPIGPEDNIVFVWVAPALEEVKKEMTGFNVDISCVRPSKGATLSGNISRQGGHLLDTAVADRRLFHPHTVSRKGRV